MDFIRKVKTTSYETAVPITNNEKDKLVKIYEGVVEKDIVQHRP